MRRLLLFCLLTLAGAVAWSPGAESQTLAAARARGHVLCGVSTGAAGFSIPDARGEWRGFDVDICRAVAAAALGDGERIRFVPLSAAQRFPAVASGEVDILS